MAKMYKRTRNGTTRFYGDFRDFSDVGGGQEALIADGCTTATDDKDVAEKVFGDRLDELKAARRRRVHTGVRQSYGLKEFAALHLERKAEGGVSEKWLVAVENQLQRAVAHFGKDRDLASICPSDIRAWVEELRQTSNGRGLMCPDCGTRGDVDRDRPRATCPECGEEWTVETLGEKTIRDHLNSLSNLYRRAQGKEAVPGGYNPVKAWLGSMEDSEKPSGGRTGEADWLEPHEAALLLEAARTWEPTEEGAPNVTFAHPLLATFLLTGGRKSEVLGLEVDDVDLEDRHVIRFRPNEHRDLKTDTSTRTVPVWPQLREILSAYLESDDSPDEGLLFPSPRTGKMLKDVRRTLDALGKRCGFAEGEIRLHRFRHTYCATRIQTTEHGAPVALFTVARELGHASTRLIERRYGHLLTNRKARGEHVEFRPETYEEELGKRLHELRVVA